MKTNKTVSVRYHNRLVGTLADAGNGQTAFAYADEWLQDGFSISPFSLHWIKRYSCHPSLIFPDYSEYLQTVFPMPGVIFW